MMSFESPKKAAECFQSPLVASSMARMVVLSVMRGDERGSCGGVRNFFSVEVQDCP